MRDSGITRVVRLGPVPLGRLSTCPTTFAGHPVLFSEPQCVRERTRAFSWLGEGTFFHDLHGT